MTSYLRQYIPANILFQNKWYGDSNIPFSLLAIYSVILFSIGNFTWFYHVFLLQNKEMLYQLPNGKVIHLSVEEYLALTDLDIQFLMSIDYGDHIIDPFLGSAVEQNSKSKYIDTDFLPLEDYDLNDIPSDDLPFDDIIDLQGPLDN